MQLIPVGTLECLLASTRETLHYWIEITQEAKPGFLEMDLLSTLSPKKMAPAVKVENPRYNKAKVSWPVVVSLPTATLFVYYKYFRTDVPMIAFVWSVFPISVVFLILRRLLVLI